MTTTRSMILTVGVLGLLASAITAGTAAPRVEVNGRPITFSAPPIQLDSTILAPVRDICRALGADVVWNAATQTATATRGANRVEITIGADSARVNGRTVAVDVPAMVYRGATMVPLAFLSTSLGAEVRWSASSQTVSIITGNAGNYDQYPDNNPPSDNHQYPGDYEGTRTQRIVVPAGTVIPVTLDTDMGWPSSSSARVPFTATVDSDRNGDADVPRGTKFAGSATSQRRGAEGQPQWRSVTIVEAQLTNGTSVPIDGSLIAISDRSVTRSADGRLTATAPTTSRYGGRGSGIDLSQGTALGVRLNRDAALNVPSAFVRARDTYLTGLTTGTDQPPYGEVYGSRSVRIPRGTVIPVSLDEALNSATSGRGDTFTVTVRSSREGDAEFPSGTRLMGTVVGVQRARDGQPGTMDLSFREARLPDGSAALIDGSPISLDDRSVTTSSDGRLVATAEASNDQLKFIGIGTGAGLIIGKLLDQNLIVGGLLGAAAGYLYNQYQTDDNEASDVNVKTGTVFGVRMDRDVTYSASAGYADSHATYLTNGGTANDQYPWGQGYGSRSMRIPEGTVIPVTLDGALNSSRNRRGETFSVTVRSSQDGDAEFPRGTRITGTIVDVQRASNGEPGTMDLSFREARLPDGTTVALEGAPISLDDKSVTTSSDGRLVATAEAKDDKLKMIGIGAGAGLIIGKLLDQNLIVGGLLGAAAGYLYNQYAKDDSQPTDVNVSAGTEFGVRMDSDVSYRATADFASARDAYLRSR